jgi:predicted HicB family RNase H-like nuclease
MAYTEARKRANLKYAVSKLKRVPLDMLHADYDALKAAADRDGLPVNTYIKEAISSRMAGRMIPDSAATIAQDAAAAAGVTVEAWTVQAIQEQAERDKRRRALLDELDG